MFLKRAMCHAQVIAEKLLDYLRTATDDGQKAEVAQRIGELAERFAPDTQWFIDTMNQVQHLPCGIQEQSHASCCFWRSP